MVHHRAAVLDPVFVWLSRIGVAGLVWLVLALVAAYVVRRPIVFPTIVLTVFLADVLALALKAVTDVERPSVRYAEPEPLVATPRDQSFPSGHAATSFCAARLLSEVLPRFTVPFYLLAVAIAFSRVYVGVHYPIDVIGGAVLGLAVSYVPRLISAGRTRRRRRSAAKPPGMPPPEPENEL